MPGILLSLLKNWRAVLPIIATLLIGGFFLYYRVTVSNLRQERDDLRLELSTTEANLEATQRLNLSERKAIDKNQSNERESYAHTRLLREKASMVGPDSDGPVAPVLRDAIGGLRSHN